MTPPPSPGNAKDFTGMLLLGEENRTTRPGPETRGFHSFTSQLKLSNSRTHS
jgi:hypothetical protein